MPSVCRKELEIRDTRLVVAQDEAQPPRRNVWAVTCLGLVATSWGLLAYLALADAILSGDTASDSSFVPVYVLIGVVTAAAPFVGLEGLTAVSRSGQAWLAWVAFVLALMLPAIYTVTLILLRDGIFPSPDSPD
jgi:FtsH-binding integral membrane protein